MKAEIISFVTAKALHKKGFNEEDLFPQVHCSWYNAFGTVNGRTDLNKDQEHVCASGYFQNEEERANNVSDLYLAPTQDFVCQWLRRKFDIHVQLDWQYLELFLALPFLYSCTLVPLANFQP